MFALPSTTWMALLAATVFGLSAAGLVYLKIVKARQYEQRRKEAADALRAAEIEAHLASLSGDPNRIHNARVGLQHAVSRAVDYGIG